MRTFPLPKPQRAISLVTEIQFGVQLEFFTPPISVSEASQALRGRDCVFHYYASALQESGLQAAYLLDKETEKDYLETQCQGNNGGNGRNSGGQETGNQLQESIVKTKHNPDMYIMSPQSSIPWVTSGAKENPLFRYWLIKSGSDIGGCGKHAAWHPTTLNSPTLRESEANNLFPGLNTAIYTTWTAHPTRVHVNDNCGLHVHVSPALVSSLAQGVAQGLDQGQQQHHGQRQNLTALQAQRVATLVIVLEDGLLFHLCSPLRHRTYRQLAAGLGFAHAPTLPASPLADVEANLPPSILKGTGAIEKAIRLLWTASDLDQVRQMLLCRPKARDSCPAALRISAYTHEDDGVTHTLEFRHAQAAFYQGFVDNWVRLVLTLCKVAFLPSERFKLVVAML
ncbi:hypothetical protein V8C35DRAFT_178989 [Trichoderma chlorosporum]